MGGDYILAWCSFLLSAAVLLVVFWRLLDNWGLKGAKVILCLLAACFLLTPVPLAPGSSFWAPAFMAAGIDFVTSGAEAGLGRLLPVLIAMISAVFATFGWRFYRNRQK